MQCSFRKVLLAEIVENQETFTSQDCCDVKIGQTETKVPSATQSVLQHNPGSRALSSLSEAVKLFLWSENRELMESYHIIATITNYHASIY